MQLLRQLAVCLAVVCTTNSFALAGTRMAPADEYFGPLHQSILEIRNRLTAFENLSGDDLARNVVGIDNVEVAIEDWYRQYPADPWLAGFMDRTQRLYYAAGALEETHARHLGVLLIQIRR